MCGKLWKKQTNKVNTNTHEQTEHTKHWQSSKQILLAEQRGIEWE